MYSKIRLIIIPLALFILTSCAGVFISPDAKSEFELGLALFNQGKYEEAVPHFQKASEIEPEYPKAYIYLGRSYLSLSQWFQAIPPLRTAYNLAPQETKEEVVNILLDALIGAAVAELKKGNFNSSIDYLKESLQLEPDSVEVKKELVKTLVMFGGKLLADGKPSDAVSVFSDALEIAPKNLNVYMGLAKALFKKGDFMDAIRIISSALSIATTEKERSEFQDLLTQ